MPSPASNASRQRRRRPRYTAIPNAAALSPDVLLDPPSSLNTLPAAFGEAVNAPSIKLVLELTAPPCSLPPPTLDGGLGDVLDILKLRARGVVPAGAPGLVGLTFLNASRLGSLSTLPCVDILKLRNLDPPPAFGGELKRDGVAGAGAGAGCAIVAVDGPASRFGDGGTVPEGDTGPRCLAKNDPMPAPHVLNLSPAVDTLAFKSGLNGAAGIDADGAPSASLFDITSILDILAALEAGVLVGGLVAA